LAHDFASEALADAVPERPELLDHYNLPETDEGVIYPQGTVSEVS
jgi:hypothetical protein